jgi:hypothetical protein
MTPVAPKAMHEGARLVVFAKDQPEYSPLPAAVSPDGVVMTEWELSAEDLAALLNGGRLRLWVWTFRHALQPVMLETVER